MAARVEHNAEPIPGYRLLDRLGGGGFGEVWRASAPGGMQKAIKFVFGDLSSAGDSQRAEQELKALKRVQSVRHPYILTLERYDIVDGQLMIVMELADRSLWDRFKECRAQGLPGVPREELLRYMEEAAEALDLMNQEYQLQHLDIKPQNLFLVHNHIKVADFGLVKDLENSQASVTGGITPVYAAPETFDGKVTRFSDQYSFAIVYQELLTGVRPFTGTNIRQLILQHLQGVPNVSPLPPDDQPHILRALSKVPAERFPTCKELVTHLRASGGLPVPSSPSTQGHPFPAQLTAPSTGAMPVAPPGASWQGLTAPAGFPTHDTPSSQGVTQNIRAIESPSVLRARSEGDTARPPQEQTGPGTLLPALVIGLGQMGLTVLQKAREAMNTYAAPLSQLTNLRFLLIDTDPEVVRSQDCPPAAALAASECLITPLNRPSHYLKPRDGRPPIEPWLNPRLLYRIPRSQVTTGVRGLGRLAFIDHYRPIMRRLQLELDAILDPAALQSAARQSRLGLRTTRPRVYVITSLGGGTGSGMFIDLAYNLRALLEQMGYQNPDIVALLLLPPAEGGKTRLLSLGNAYAALAELNHFAGPSTVFRAKYHDREAPLEDAAPPFSRTMVLPLPDEADEVATREVVELCGQLLYREIGTPLGKAADLARGGMPAPPWEQRGQFAQTFGMFQLTWPRHALVQNVSRELCRRLVQRWQTKDSKPIRQSVQDWIEQQWSYLDLGADVFIHRMQTETIKTLGRPTDALFVEALAPLNKPSAQGDPPAAKVRGKQERRLTQEQVAEVLANLEELVGSPEFDNTNAEPPRLARLVRESAECLAGVWSQRLVELPVRLIEEPAFRLAGAEEAARLLVANVEQVLQTYEPLARELAEKALEAHDHLSVASGQPVRQGVKVSPKTAEQIVELCRQYPKYRFQLFVLSHLTAAFVGLRGHLSDELREIGFCRTRLTELLRLLEESVPGEAGKSAQGLGRVLFVSGCKDLPEAVQMTLEGITPEQMLELDGEMEKMLRGSFTALVHVCLASQSLLRPLERAMLQTAGDFVSRSLPATSVAGLFFERHQGEEAASEAVDMYHQAAPELAAKRSAHGVAPELCVLAAPADSDSEDFRQMLAEGVSHVEWNTAASAEDIVIYRERVNVALTALEPLGTAGHAAYVQLNNNENFTPHSRSDVDFRR